MPKVVHNGHEYFIFGSGADATLKEKTITTNGTYNATSDDADGYSKVTVNVNASTEEKSITTNGTYTPSSGNVGFSKVTVNVPTGTVRGTLTTDDLSGETMLAGIYSATNIGTATRAEVLNGKTFTSTAGIRTTGTMTNKGAWTGTGTPSGNNQTNITIPAGYHNGSGYVTCKGQTSYSAGYTAGVNATKASRVTAWSGSTTGNVSVNLSAYKWVYVTLKTNADYPEQPQGTCILPVGGGARATGVMGRTWGWDLVNCISISLSASTSGITREGMAPNASSSNYIITSVVGIKNLS